LNPDSRLQRRRVGGASIGSALGHTWRQKEIMVVDHDSTDGTLASVRQFESNKVRVVTQPNQGAAAARVPSAGDTANPNELKNDLEIRIPARVAGAILRAEAAPPSGTRAGARASVHTAELRMNWSLLISTLIQRI
jgi:glycosyltransferase involved in cell wall biosynthesis